MRIIFPFQNTPIFTKKMHQPILQPLPPLRVYSPFGAVLEGRSWSAESGYRYGFNGKEKDDEGMGGGGQTYDYGFRIYNPSLAKFLSVDPLSASYPELTSYQFASNTPIQAIDLDGLEAWISTNEAELVMSHADYQKFIQSTSLKLVNKGDVSDNQFDCANFVITMLALYYKEKGVRFNYVIGGVRIDSDDSKYDFNEFQERLWGVASASNIRGGELSKVIAEEEMETGDLINTGGHVQIYLGTNSDPADKEPVKAVQSSGMYYGKDNAENSTNPPSFESYEKIWAEGYRWTFLDKIPSRQIQQLCTIESKSNLHVTGNSAPTLAPSKSMLNSNTAKNESKGLWNRIFPSNKK
jgi:RHS repeat-associated protein